jgi:hypothetical protein
MSHESAGEAGGLGIAQKATPGSLARFRHSEAYANKLVRFFSK